MREFHPVVREALDAGVSVKIAWKRGNPEIRADAQSLWLRLGILPPGVELAARADEIVATAYVAGVVAGVATAYIDTVALVRQRFALWRVAVAPESRRNHVMRALAGYSRAILEEWSLAHPEEAVMGMASVTENAELNAAKLPAVIPSAGLMLIGYNAAGGRIRVAWFDHARV